MALGVAACSGAAAPSHLTVTGAWARSTPEGATNGVIYLTISGPTDVLVGVAVAPSDAASVSMHETMGGAGDAAHMPGMDMSGDAGAAIHMAALTTVPVAPGNEARFEPGGRHIMLEGLHHPLVRGMTLTLTLTFRIAGPMRVDVPVLDNPPA